MKTKTEAAKILLKAGWTLEEVLAVLGKDDVPQPPIVWPVPYPYPVQVERPWWMPPTITWTWIGGDSTAEDSSKYVVY